MDTKRTARLVYYEGVKRAMVEHMLATEEGIRTLDGISLLKVERLIADVHRRHLRLLRRIDQHIEDERRDAI